jgi:hypothetical protein
MCRQACMNVLYCPPVFNRKRVIVRNGNFIVKTGIKYIRTEKSMEVNKCNVNYEQGVYSFSSEWMKITMLYIAHMLWWNIKPCQATIQSAYGYSTLHNSKQYEQKARSVEIFTIWCSELSSGLYCRVRLLLTDVSEVRTASIIRDE